MWEVEYTDEFNAWWTGLTEAEQTAITAYVQLLQQLGPHLKRPHADLIQSSRHAHMKELRVQCAGEPIRILFAFDPRRIAILLIGGNKTGDNNWYEKTVPIADDLYDEYIAELIAEGKLKNG